jgi:hypothetical protein
MPRQKPHQPDTVAQAFERVIGGIDPWIVIGDFLDDWRSASRELRQGLIETPIKALCEDPALHRWAVFFAAMVEQLCLEAGLAVPEWVERPEYMLVDPWYLYRGTRAEWHAWQEATSPEPFKKRRIYGGDQILTRA